MQNLELLSVIKKLKKDHNISNGLLAEALGLTRHSLLTLLNHTQYDISQKTFNRLKAGIDKIVQGEVDLNRNKEVIEYHQPEKKNINEIRQFLKSNKISHQKASSVLGKTKSQFQGYLAKRKRLDISDEKKNEIISTLKEKLNL